MKCPNPNCGQKIESVSVQRVAASTGNYKGTFKAVSYCCEACGTVLGVESEPLERNAQMEEIRTTAAKLSGQMDIVLKKLVTLAASVTALKASK